MLTIPIWSKLWKTLKISKKTAISWYIVAFAYTVMNSKQSKKMVMTTMMIILIIMW